MDTQPHETDFALLARDPYTFSVLDRILRGPCDLIRTDHQRLILCHSEAPYPVWLWTPDGCPEEAKEQAWALAEACRPLDQGYRYNMKHELAEYFIEKARQQGKILGIHMQLFAYDCPSPIPPDRETDGALHVCTQDDLPEAAALFSLFHTEIGDDAPTLTRCREKAQGYIDQGALFFWKNAAGKNAACCICRFSQGLATIGHVLTRPEERRKHYAQHLVYQVTKRAADKGYTPMLFTDADYPASNACYEKIGYRLRGRLCTLAALG